MSSKLEVLTCLVCGGTEFEVKNNKGNILLHCKKCLNPATIKNAGVGEAKGDIEPDTIVYPEEKEKTEKKESDFISMSIRVRKDQKELIKSAFNVMREQRGLDRKGFAGTSLFYICIDYLSGVDIFDFCSPETIKATEEALKNV